jgi:hypothetical protein
LNGFPSQPADLEIERQGFRLVYIENLYPLHRYDHNFSVLPRAAAFSVTVPAGFKVPASLPENVSCTLFRMSEQGELFEVVL